VTVAGPPPADSAGRTTAGGAPKPRFGHLPGRFEWKILTAVLIVALLPIGAAALFVSRTLTAVSEMNSRHQHLVRESLGEALEAYRSFFAQEKETFREHATEIAAEGVSVAAELADVPDLLRARILVGPHVVDEWSVAPEELAQSREAPPNLVELPARGDQPARALELTFGIDRQVYANFLSLRQAIEQEQELDRVLPLLLPGLFRALAANLVVVVVVAVLIGLFVARRATRRVAILRRAASRVAMGDLSVQVAPRGRDELDDLGRAFDRMVGELRDARSRLEYMQKVTAWQEVARRLAHEIKNPLTPVRLAMQELKSQYRGEDLRYQRLLDSAAEIMDEEVGAIRRLVDDFSAFAKLPKVEPTPVDLGAIVDDFVRAHPEWGAAVEFRRPGDQIHAMCDRMLVRRVLANLVENALQAAAAAGQTPKVRITFARGTAPRTTAVHVDDNGPGVPSAIGDRVFDPYFTTKESGTGLGLAIVRKIVIDHGGDVRIDRAPPPLGGARFTVELPASRSAVMAQLADSE